MLFPEKSLLNCRCCIKIIEHFKFKLLYFIKTNRTWIYKYDDIKYSEKFNKIIKNQIKIWNKINAVKWGDLFQLV